MWEINVDIQNEALEKERKRSGSTRMRGLTPYGRACIGMCPSFAAFIYLLLGFASVHQRQGWLLLSYLAGLCRRVMDLCRYGVRNTRWWISPRARGRPSLRKLKTALILIFELTFTTTTPYNNGYLVIFDSD